MWAQWIVFVLVIALWGHKLLTTLDAAAADKRPWTDIVFGLIACVILFAALICAGTFSKVIGWPL